MDGVVSVFLNQVNELHTTRSWDFIGFPQNVQRTSTESDIIIGVLDTGIWPESASFDDSTFGPPPSKWRGACQVTTSFKACNNKIIGARYYRTGSGQNPPSDISPRDTNGHGSHVSSTAAGGVVSGANLYGLGSGIARGGVPKSRIAVYKVCWSDIGCTDADILAAFNDAIADGVDIISASLGFSVVRDYFENPISIGSFYAMKKNILTSTSAGNDGPYLETLKNFAPWSISVAASTTDRQFTTQLVLGNNQVYEGISINTFDLQRTPYAIIYGGDAPNTAGGFSSLDSRKCITNSLNPNLVRGKIVLCDSYNSVRESLAPATTALNAGAVGVVVQGGRRIAGDDKSDNSIPLSGSYLNAEYGSRTLIYIKSTSNPFATILKSNQGTNRLAPYIASLSSRGPNPITPNILKPDLAAPGAEILAAWSPISPVSMVQGDTRFVAFNIISGTSMACPHVSGAAAYVKSFNPSWSPAAIQSALMTTARPMNPNLNPEAEFAYGAGQINPVGAKTPGLVYDIRENDYINFLCGQGYTDTLVQIISGTPNACSGGSATTELNSPAFVLRALPGEAINHVFRRTVTNVGTATSTYSHSGTAPGGLRVTVNPSVLTFTSLGQTLSYTVTLQGTLNDNFVASGSLVWSAGTFQVRSPIVVYVAS